MTAKINHTESLNIKIIRVLSIFFMTFVHVNPGSDNWPNTTPEHLSLMGSILIDFLGRGSVPVLSIISGYLAIYAYQRRANYLKYIKERFNTLIIPLVTWNIIIIFISFIIFQFTKVQTSVYKELTSTDLTNSLNIIDILSGLQYGSATIALNFLRDVFAISLFLPVLIYLFNRIGILAVLSVWAIGLTIGFEPIVYRPHIFMFFSIGLYFAIAKKHDPNLVKPFKILSLTLLTCLVCIYLLPQLQAYHDNLTSATFRLIVSILFLLSTYWLSFRKLGHYISQAEPAIYLTFLSHNTIMLILWGAWQLLFGASIKWPYTIFFILAPIFTLTICVLLTHMIKHLPGTLQIATAGKKK